MRIVDPALPATQHLVGPGAADVLRLPIEASGGEIDSFRVIQVQYRPGSDVVVRYSVHVSWQGAAPVRETIVAASAVHRSYPGVVPIEADTAGGRIEVGVWRWPFDPFLPGLAEVVNHEGAARVIGADPSDLRVEIVAFRPTERAVVRVSDSTGPVAYVKVVEPARVGGIAGRHEALRDAGVPAPCVTHVDEANGVMAMEPLVGPTFRDLIKAPDGPVSRWPRAEEFVELCDRIRSTSLAAPAPASHLVDGIGHARMLATVLPSAASVLDDVVARLETIGAPPIDGTVHGDLHEGQVIIDDGAIAGVLDVDDAGPGASVDDPANLIARLHYRESTNTGPLPELRSHRTRLRELACRVHPPDRLDRHTAAALLGLATGPFRLQADDWEVVTGRLVDLAAAVLPD